MKETLTMNKTWKNWCVKCVSPSFCSFVMKLSSATFKMWWIFGTLCWQYCSQLGKLEITIFIKKKKRPIILFYAFVHTANGLEHMGHLSMLRAYFSLIHWILEILEMWAHHVVIFRTISCLYQIHNMYVYGCKEAEFILGFHDSSLRVKLRS